MSGYDSSAPRLTEDPTSTQKALFTDTSFRTSPLAWSRTTSGSNGELSTVVTEVQRFVSVRTVVKTGTAVDPPNVATSRTAPLVALCWIRLLAVSNND